MPLLLCVCSLLMHVQVAVPQTEVTLKFQPDVGKTYKYRTSMEMSMDSGAAIPTNSMKSGMDIDLKVLGKKDGIFTVESTTGNATFDAPSDSPLSSMKDTMIAQMNGKVVKIDIDENFKPHGSSGTGLDAIFSSMQGINFPTKSIKIGDSWTSEMDLKKMLVGMLGKAGPEMKISGDMPIKNKFESFDLVKGATAANIKMTMNGDLQVTISGQDMTMHITADGNFKIDVATGTMVSMKMVSDNKITAASITMIQHMVQSMTLR